MNSKSTQIYRWRSSLESNSDTVACQSVHTYFRRTAPGPCMMPRTYVIYDENSDDTTDEALESQLDMYLDATCGGFEASILRAPSDVTECIHPALDNAVYDSFTPKKSQGADGLEKLLDVSTIGLVPASLQPPEKHVAPEELPIVIRDYGPSLLRCRPWITRAISLERQGRATTQPEKGKRDLSLPHQDPLLFFGTTVLLKHKSQNGQQNTASYKLFLRRETPSDGTLIIIVDVVVLFVLLIAALGVILCTVAQRRKRRRLENVALQELNGAETDLEVARGAVEIESPDDRASTNPGKTSLEHHITLSSFGELLVPTPPATRSASPKLSPRMLSSSPLGDIVGALGSLRVPNSYGDPYANWSYQDAPGSEAHSILSRKSSSTSHRIFGSFKRLSTRSFNEPALSDTRSGVLSRNESTSSTAVLSRSFSKSSSSTSRTDRPPVLSVPRATLARTSRTPLSSEFPSTLRPLYKEPDPTQQGASI
ncbi:hypothetical protein HYPSUDRAFT_637164 [Hypholoma sublateritium FD-334 SS-4]|uniref:Uncharacterized protein n=1 Tax=Hypholoma sublateritium (strain FD-334 SS-4) TaxID=945553 RepID=A0A0D2MGK2_HYPSF|nr:hypothetical protein HYPSUDRAFT_637164 [Hypholoma sublateritium FD-334 SS-4]